MPKLIRLGLLEYCENHMAVILQTILPTCRRADEAAEDPFQVEGL
ncbi:MAG TPA: hypothetical protein VEC06_02530 [Paucimonas sp.]|nr:hypothetical protein [Paucimonas sp.]